MALASQMTRSDRRARSWGASSGARRRPGRGAAIVLLLGVAAIGGGAWGIVRLRAGPSAEIAGTPEPSAAAANTFESATAAMTDSPAAPLPEAGPGDAAPTELTHSAGDEAARSALATQTSGAGSPPPAPSTDVKPVSSTPAPAPASPAAPAAPPPTVVVTPSSGPLPADLQASVSAADKAWKENRLVEARTLLNRALLDPRTGEGDRAALRAQMMELNRALVFSAAVLKGDPLAETYTVASGDGLGKITAKMGLGVDWRLIQRINGIANPSRIHAGQKLKVVRGPFHAVVDKSDFRMDIYAGEPADAGSARPARPDGVEPGWIYIRSFPVGLGEKGTTPTGTFVVRRGSKLIDPFWKNPRTGEEFAPSDPKNPIGERWLGLEGLDEATKAFQGYGVHGTIDPGSIGQERSMGCVRLASDDIALVYEMLEEGFSVVRIVP